MRAWSDAALEGLWLTAQRWDDAALTQVHDVLPASVAVAAREVGGRFARLERGDKARALRASIAGVRPAVPTQASLPPRALAWLAVDVPKEAGRAWLQAAPAPRAGFQPSSGLRAWLARLARARRNP